MINTQTKAEKKRSTLFPPQERGIILLRDSFGEGHAEGSFRAG